MSDNTELRVNLLKEIYEYYVHTNGDSKIVELDKPRGKLTLAYTYLYKRKFIQLSLCADSSNVKVRISMEGVDFLKQRGIIA